MTDFLLLSGGRSSRYGSDKKLLQINGENITEMLIRKATESGLFDNIYISVRPDDEREYKGAIKVKDSVPLEGPLSGILSVLKVSDGKRIAVWACDMPAFSKEFTEKLLYEYERLSCSSLVPSVNGKPEPLAAVIDTEKARECMDRIISSNEKRVMKFHEMLVYTEYPASSKDVFFNINYVEDYIEYIEK